MLARASGLRGDRRLGVGSGEWRVAGLAERKRRPPHFSPFAICHEFTRHLPFATTGHSLSTGRINTSAAANMLHNATFLGFWKGCFFALSRQILFAAKTLGKIDQLMQDAAWNSGKRPN